MKYRLLSILLLILVLSGCNKQQEQSYDKFDFLIDSIYNITTTSATIKATLVIHEVGVINISGLSVDIRRTFVETEDSLHQILFFNKSAGTVELTATNLKPNTLYYVSPIGNFNPPFDDPYKPRITGIGSPNSTKTFTTLDK